MVKWNILAWDDNPKVYLDELAKKLEQNKQIEVTVTVKIDDCDKVFFENPDEWDCLILDIMDESYPDKSDIYAGVNKAIQFRTKRPDILIIFITTDPGLLFTPGREIKEPYFLRPKNYSTTYLAREIIEHLEEHAKENDKVFLISNSDKSTKNIKDEATDAIKKSGFRCEFLEPQRSFHSITESLVNTMKKCKAFVALCTPDDNVDGKFQPRQNVLLEMGMALALGDGFKSLVIMQQDGKTPELKAELPSDLGGAYTIKFDDNYKEKLDNMIEALKERGVRSRLS